MGAPSEPSSRGGIGRLAGATLAFAMVAPLGFVSAPLASALLSARLRRSREFVVLGVALGAAAAWLAIPGDLAAQTMRVAALFVAVSFAAATGLRTGFTHRALLTVATAAVGVIALYAVVGVSWDELQWSVQHGGRAVPWWILPGPLGGAVEAWTGAVASTTAPLFPAKAALVAFAGLWLARGWHRWASAAPSPSPVGFRSFGFSSHLGWAAVGPLVVLLVPGLAAAKTAAANVLLVLGALYALRGVAVGTFLLQGVGAGGFLYAVLGLIFLLVLPVALSAALVLGVLDAGLNLRRRWSP